VSGKNGTNDKEGNDGTCSILRFGLVVGGLSLGFRKI